MIEDFNTVIDLPYDVFLEQLDADSSGEYYDLLLLAKSAMESSFEAVKLSFDRIEGLQETPVSFDVPHFYTRYIKATRVEGSETKALAPPEKEDDFDIATAKLRDTLKKMRSMPRQTPDTVMATKMMIDENKETKHIPLVKMIICANLIILSRRKPKIVAFVFDQIYGKLVRTVKLLDGEDFYVDNRIDTVAPAGSFKDEHGVYVAENMLMRNQFIAGFAKMGGQFAGLKVEDE